MSRARALSIVGVLALAACAEPPVTPVISLTSGRMVAAVEGGAKTYVLLSSSNSLPSGLAASVADVGGTLTSSMDGIGVAVASSTDPDFAAKAGKVKGLQAVVEDVVMDFAQPRVGGEFEADAIGEPDVGLTGVGSGEFYRVVQWAPDAVHAPEAWDAGYQGKGARVAIIDGGIWSKHQDIEPNFDFKHSRSFVSGQAYDFDQMPDPKYPKDPKKCIDDTFWHGTHVAGIVAAPANKLGTVGIAPVATIIGVKALHCGRGSFGAIINAVYYASTPIAEDGAGANIINMSLGAEIDGRGPGIAHLLSALSRATSYANQRGVTVVAAAGNSEIDLDHTNNLVSVPAQSVGVLAVSATGPLGWALGSTDLDRPASYTNFGQSAISFAGPGGDNALPGTKDCTVGPITTRCWVFDMVLAPCRGRSTSSGSYCFAAGTSMASPAVAGVAALIIGKYGPISPAQVEAKLRQSADDLGKPGNDDYYGRGRVNAYRAIQ